MKENGGRQGDEGVGQINATCAEIGKITATAAKICPFFRVNLFFLIVDSFLPFVATEPVIRQRSEYWNGSEQGATSGSDAP